MAVAEDVGAGVVVGCAEAQGNTFLDPDDEIGLAWLVREIVDEHLDLAKRVGVGPSHRLLKDREAHLIPAFDPELILE